MAAQVVGPLKVVSLTYEIRGEQDDLLERIDMPVSYLHGGRGQLFPQVERALAGHGVGDVVEVSLSPEEGFGWPDPNLTSSHDIQGVPPEYRRVGAEAQFQNERGETVTMTVTRIADGKVVLDGNHPFAGKRITFKVTIADIREATPQEVARGLPDGASLTH